jgi:cobalt-zinc-cadmium resistance protein CzcA
VEGIVLMRRWENPSEVLDALHDAIDEINGSRLPPGVRIVPIYDRTSLVRNTLRTVSRVLLEGFVIVVTVLLVFLLSVRAALLTALVIPLSLLFAFICMRAAGVSLSLLGIGAIDFKHHRGRDHRDGRAPHAQVARRRGADAPRASSRRCARRARRPAPDPVLAAHHHRGLHPAARSSASSSLFTPMAMTVCFALLGSLLLSLTWSRRSPRICSAGRARCRAIAASSG